MGAGILPVTIHYGTLFLLFGKEKSCGKWSDFGGSQKDQYESSFTTAIREGSEELNGIYGTDNYLKSRVSKNLINIYQINNYKSYLFKVKKDNNLPKYFQNIDHFSKKNLPLKLYNSEGLFEKEKIKWFSIDELEKEIINFRPFYRYILSEIIEDKDQIYNDIKFNNFYFNKYKINCYDNTKNYLE